MAGSYLDKDFVPKQEFWSALWVGNTCHVCNYQMNGYTMKADLLEGPQDCKCNKCGAEWSLGVEDKNKEEIRALLRLEQRFYSLRNELRDVINILQEK